ncbi:16S rRNA (guanine(966)-N(2))-methyltransferase RsmD [Marinicellulosiphila megalodicopiae]|uniref:16S rRNA (guanine(966)-N(2))-methyltransferase RsmD n=1 Tax=Marinicellulosiphila megalodicopiae TaxID=2724896 RepID=UPI003BAFA66F
MIKKSRHKRTDTPDQIEAPVKRKKKSNATEVIGNIRIIAGDWRSRKINVIDQDGLRPTTNRVKETVFNWLQVSLSAAKVLDVFAGTGSLGLEALSRGAQSCHFNELSAPVSIMLKQNIESLGAQDKSKVTSQNALMLLKGSCVDSMDLVLLDPPFGLNIYTECFELMLQNGWVKQGSLIYCESGRRVDFDVPAGLKLKKEKVAGQVCCRLFEVI